MVTWLPSWYLHWGGKTTSLVPTPRWLDNHRGTYTVVTWIESIEITELKFLTCGCLTGTIMVPTLLWRDYHCGSYTVVTCPPLWYLHCDNLTPIVVNTLWRNASMETLHLLSLLTVQALQVTVVFFQDVHFVINPFTSLFLISALLTVGRYIYALNLNNI